MGAAFYRSMPPYVSQSETYLCWAAALDSWLGAVPDRSRRNQVDLLAAAIEAGVVADNGSLLKKGLVWISANFDMTMKVFSKQKRLTVDYLLGRLKKKGYLYLVWNPGGDVAHCQVIWGVNPDFGALAYMDPWKGEGYNLRPVQEYYYDAAEFVVGYPA